MTKLARFRFYGQYSTSSKKRDLGNYGIFSIEITEKWMSGIAFFGARKLSFLFFLF